MPSIVSAPSTLYRRCSSTPDARSQAHLRPVGRVGRPDLVGYLVDLAPLSGSERRSLLDLSRVPRGAQSADQRRAEDALWARVLRVSAHGYDVDVDEPELAERYARLIAGQEAPRSLRIATSGPTGRLHLEWGNATREAACPDLPRFMAARARLLLRRAGLIPRADQAKRAAPTAWVLPEDSDGSRGFVDLAAMDRSAAGRGAVFRALGGRHKDGRTRKVLSPLNDSLGCGSASGHPITAGMVDVGRREAEAITQARPAAVVLAVRPRLVGAEAEARDRGYAAAALTAIVRDLGGMTEGGRNNALYASARRLRAIERALPVDWPEQLLAAALACGLDASEAASAIRSACVAQDAAGPEPLPSDLEPTAPLTRAPSVAPVMAAVDSLSDSVLDRVVDAVRGLAVEASERAKLIGLVVAGACATRSLPPAAARQIVGGLGLHDYDARSCVTRTWDRVAHGERVRADSALVGRDGGAEVVAGLNALAEAWADRLEPIALSDEAKAERARRRAGQRALGNVTRTADDSRVSRRAVQLSACGRFTQRARCQAGCGAAPRESAMICGLAVCWSCGRRQDQSVMGWASVRWREEAPHGVVALRIVSDDRSKEEAQRLRSVLRQRVHSLYGLAARYVIAPGCAVAVLAVSEGTTPNALASALGGRDATAVGARAVGAMVRAAIEDRRAVLDAAYAAAAGGDLSALASGWAGHGRIASADKGCPLSWPTRESLREAAKAAAAEMGGDDTDATCCGKCCAPLTWDYLGPSGAPVVTGLDRPAPLLSLARSPRGARALLREE